MSGAGHGANGPASEERMAKPKWRWIKWRWIKWRCVEVPLRRSAAASKCRCVEVPLRRSAAASKCRGPGSRSCSPGWAPGLPRRTGWAGRVHGVAAASPARMDDLAQVCHCRPRSLASLRRRQRERPERARRHEGATVCRPVTGIARIGSLGAWTLEVRGCQRRVFRLCL